MERQKPAPLRAIIGRTEGWDSHVVLECGHSEYRPKINGKNQVRCRDCRAGKKPECHRVRVAGILTVSYVKTVFVVGDFAGFDPQREAREAVEKAVRRVYNIGDGDKAVNLSSTTQELTLLTEPVRGGRQNDRP